MFAKKDAGIMLRALQMAGLNSASRARHSLFQSWFPVRIAYVSMSFSTKVNVKESIGFEGDFYNNAMAESLFAMSETGLIDRQPRPRFRSKVEANREIFATTRCR